VALTKTTSAGVVTLAGVNTYTGATNVNAGMLIVTGSIANSAVAVNVNSTLAGTGTTGAITVFSNTGIVAPGIPGGAIGTLNAPSADFGTNNGVLQIRIPNNTTADSLALTGGATLGGACSLVIDLNGYTPAMGALSTAVITSAGVGGAFPPANISAINNTSGKNFDVVYIGTSVFVRIDTTPIVDLNGPVPAGINYTVPGFGFREGLGAVSIVDPTMTVTHPNTPGDLVSATVTITNPLDGAAESLAATASGAIPQVNIVYAAGVLTITGPAPVADFQAVLATVTYNNTQVNPNTTARLVDFVVTDAVGLASTLNTATVPATPIAPARSTVPVNARPIVDLNGPAAGVDFLTSQFQEGGGAISIVDAGLTVTDGDADTIVSATVTITNLQDAANEFLAATPSGAILAGDISYNPAGVLTINRVAPPADYQAVLRTVTYNNTRAGPTILTRFITFAVTDAAGLTNSPLATSAVPMNARPVILLDGTNLDFTAPGFVENGGPTSIVGAGLAATSALPTLSSTTVTITNLQDGTAEVLAATASGAIQQTDIVYTPATGVLTITRVAPPADYQAVLRTLTYNNTSELPDQTPRLVTVVLVDSALLWSLTATATVPVTEVNDVPVVRAAVAATDLGVRPTSPPPPAPQQTLDQTILDGGVLVPLVLTGSTATFSVSAADADDPIAFAWLVSYENPALVPDATPVGTFVGTNNVVPPAPRPGPIDFSANALGSTVTHTFPQAGRYTVTATVTDGRGGQVTSTLVVRVDTPPTITGGPTVQLTPFIDFDRPQTFLVTAADSDAGDLLQYTWKFFGVPTDYTNPPYPNVAGLNTAPVELAEQTQNSSTATHTYLSSHVDIYQLLSDNTFPIIAQVVVDDLHGGRTTATVTFKLASPLGTGTPTPDAPVTNPAKGLYIQTKSNHGIVEIHLLQVYDTQTGTAVAADTYWPWDTITQVTGPNGSGQLLMLETPAKIIIAAGFASPGFGAGVYLITVMDSARNPIGRKMFIITDYEVRKLTNPDLPFEARDTFITGKFAFDSAKQDRVTLRGRLALAKEVSDPDHAGATMASLPAGAHVLNMGIGNIIGTVSVTLKSNTAGVVTGTGKFEPIYSARDHTQMQGGVTSVKVRHDPNKANWVWHGVPVTDAQGNPKKDANGNPILKWNRIRNSETPSGELLLDVRLRLNDMSKAGFDTEGITNDPKFGDVGVSRPCYNPNLQQDAKGNLVLVTGVPVPVGVQPLKANDLTPVAVQVAVLVDGKLPFFTLVQAGFIIRNGKGLIVGHSTSSTTK